MLLLSKANQSLDGICFITKKTTLWSECSFVNETKCIEPGTNISIDPDDNLILVTYGRGMCSEPANIKESPDLKEPSFPSRKTTFLTIVLGVIASAGFILISLGLMYFYGVLCCVKLKKDNGNNTRPESQIMDQGYYAEIAQELPSHASKSVTSYYMNMKPLPRTDNDDYVSPSLTRKSSPAVYVNRDMTDENEV
ncbi:uncharacterized protein LOC115920928 isoform X2 [Strongylocentrotus purpuratus]|nr:uncharacterized protein LOC115920928 isoform X2 [Strongylocentrotus purpuratus]